MGRPRGEIWEVGVAEYASDPQLDGRHRKACRMGSRVRDADWDPGCPPPDMEPPGEGDTPPRGQADCRGFPLNW